LLLKGEYQESLKLVGEWRIMNQTDPISDMLTRIRNAIIAERDTVEIPYSNLKANIARLLKREGFIRDYVSEGRGVKKNLQMYLKYTPERTSVIRGLKRVSRPGCRRYINAAEIKPVMSGTGVAIITTSRGLLTDHEARKLKVGGEWLCTIW
jgi:small subunit ribosomal protein S8